MQQKFLLILFKEIRNSEYDPCLFQGAFTALPLIKPKAIKNKIQPAIQTIFLMTKFENALSEILDNIILSRNKLDRELLKIKLYNMYLLY